MIRGRLRRSAWGLCVLGLFAAPGSAKAQSPAAPAANSLINPSLNPVMNPYLSGSTVGRDQALLYFLAAQQSSGGIGSGQLSGVRPAAGTSARNRPPAEMPRSSATPGGGASRFFQRGPNRAAERGAYFGRQNRYFANNGR